MSAEAPTQIPEESILEDLVTSQSMPDALKKLSDLKVQGLEELKGVKLDWYFEIMDKLINFLANSIKRGKEYSSTAFDEHFSKDNSFRDPDQLMVLELLTPVTLFQWQKLSSIALEESRASELHRITKDLFYYGTVLPRTKPENHKDILTPAEADELMFKLEHDLAELTPVVVDKLKTYYRHMSGNLVQTAIGVKSFAVHTGSLTEELLAIRTYVTERQGGQ
jgi:hypothetical protein